MANNTSTFTLKLKTEGMEQAQQGSKQIRENLEGAQRAASATSRVARSAAAQPTGRAGASAGIGGREVEEYNRAVGASGRAGGTARDFADQARGLGGLVRLYATFAANIFALTAAFSALSRAMDTTNMIKGLDQLGAASGRNLGTLSKQLAAASDGAVSLRDAMEATVKASSAGLTSKQILEMGEGAKKAAQALGLDMTDALSRLSRGISKIEPELLDELGIYVKLEEATEKYARSIGKTASSLTDYERRQSFALAALDQLNKKFGEIQIDTNPYNKLLATFQNLLQSGLEVVNKVLGPIVKFLSESPVALTAVLLLIGKTLINQAIPYFGEFRKSIDDQAVAAKKALESAEASRSAYRSYKEELIGTAVAQKELTDRMKATAAVESLKTAKSIGSRRIASETVVSAAAAEGDIANLQVLKQASTEIDKQIKLIERRKSTTDAAKLKNQEELIVLKAAKDAIDAKVNSAKEYKDVVESTVKPKQTGMFDTSKAAKDVRDIKNATREVKSINILKDVGEVYDAEGFKAGFGKLKEQLLSSRKELGLFGTAMTAAKGTGVLLASGIGQIMSMLSGFGMAIGLAVGAFELLDSWLSTNTKQLEEFGQALEGADSSLKLVKDTTERISKQGLGSEFLPQSIEARANAFTELSAGIERTSQAFRNLNKASSWWDNLIDSLKPSGGRTSQLADSLSKQINAAFDIMKLDGARESVQKEIKSILQIKNLDNDSIRKAFKDAGSNAEELADKISKILAKASQQAIGDANRLKEALQGFDNLNKAFQDLSISLKDTSPIATFADTLIKGALQSQEALTNNTNTVSLFNEIIKDNSKLKFFSPESIKSLKDTDGAIKTTIGTIESLEKDIRDAEAAQNSLNSTMSKMSKQQLAQLEQYQKAGIETFASKLQSTIGKGEKAKLELNVNINKLKEQLQTVLNEPFLKGAQLVAAEFTRNAQKAQLDVTASLASRISGPGRAEAEYQIQKERIEIEKSSISAMYNLIQSIEKNSLTLKQVDLEKAIREERVSSRVLYEGDRSQLDALEKSLLETEAALGAVDKGLRLTIGDFNKLSATFPGIAKTLSGFFAATMGTQSKLAGQQGQLAIAGITREFGKGQEKFQDEQKRSKEELARLNIEKERASLVASIYGIESQSLILFKQQTAEKAAQKDDEINRADILNKISDQEKIRDELLKVQQSRSQVLTDAQQATLDGAKQSAEAARRELKAFDEQVELRKQLRAINNEIENQRAKTTSLEKEAELQQTLLKNGEDLAKISLDTNKQELDALISLGQVSEEYAAKRLANFAQENQAIVYQSQLREAAAVRDAAMRAALSKAAQAEISGGDPEAITAQRIEEENRALVVYEAKISAIDRSNRYTTRAIELTRQASLETAKQNEELKKQAEILGLFESISDTLAQAFGKTGDVLGKFVKTIGEVVDSQQTYNREREKQSKIIDEVAEKADAGYLSPQDMAKMNQAVKARGDLDKKNAKDEITNNAKILGSAKTLFKEKTAAYKILAGMEKAMHIARLVMDAKEIVSNISKTGVSIVESGKRMFASGQEAITAAFAAKPWPLGIIAGTAMIATIASIIGKAIGGGASAPPAGFTAEEQQKVQGSGRVYRDGKLVETGAGVLGDAAAKSKSVENAIQNMEQYDFKNLEYNNKMLEALKGIRKNTENLAGNLLRSLPGINVKPETVTGGNWLLGKSSTETLDKGIKIIGTVGQIIDQTAKIFEYENTKSTSGGFLGLFKSTNYNTQEKAITNTAIQRDLSLIFKDVGTVLGAAAEDLGMGTATEIMDAFRSVDLSEQFKRISLMDLKPDEMVEALMSVVSSGMDMAAMQLMPSLDKFRKAGESFADTVLRVANDTRVVKLSFEELGMTLPKLVEEGARPTQEQLNRLTAAQSAYNAALAANNVERQVWVEDNAYSGTGSMQTVRGTEESARALSDALIELTSAQAAVTTASNSLTTRNIELVQSYIDAAGGLDEFVERNRFFAENFLTEAERLAPVQERVNKEIARLAPQLATLGITAENNRDQFKQAVLAAQALGESGVQLYSDLMKLAPAFDMVTQEAKSAALSVEDFSKKVMGNEVDIIRMQANLLEKSGDFQAAYTKLQESVLISRQAELAELEKLPEAQKTVLKYQMEYKWSLEDLASQTENNIKINNQLIASQQSFIAYLDEAFGLLNQALRLRGEGIDAQGIERTLKLQDLSARYAGRENEVRLRVLTGLQKYVWALEDEQAAKEKYIKALQTQAQALQREIAAIDKILDQRSTIQQLTALTAADKETAQARAKTIARERELLQVRNEYDKEIVASIIANQEYIYALEDENALKDRLVEAHNREKDAIESTISSIKDAIKSIKDYRNSLAFSSELSVLTPEQQYKEARKIFEETLTAARTVGVDEAGTKAQQEALSKIPEVSNKFLELSRTLFASSGSYMTDYQVVQNALTMTEAALGEQLTEAEQQLAELKVISDALGSIEENTKTAAELFLEYGRAQERSAAAGIAASAADNRSTLELDNLRNSKLNELKIVNDKIRELGEKQLTATEAATEATEAGAAYQAATANTTKALNDISGDVNNGTIRQAIEARQAATSTITELRLANDYLNTILLNTYASYETQRTHFQNLIKTPQEVNIGTGVTTILAAIAANTAKTADNVTNVQTAVSAGTNAVVSNNTATSNQTAAIVAEAVSTTNSNWKSSTLPEIRGSGTVIKVQREP